MGARHVDLYIKLIKSWKKTSQLHVQFAQDDYKFLVTNLMPVKRSSLCFIRNGGVVEELKHMLKAKHVNNNLKKTNSIVLKRKRSGRKKVLNTFLICSI